MQYIKMNTSSSHQFIHLLLSTILFLLLTLPKVSNSQSGSFVYLEDEKFMLEGKEYFPLAVTYAVATIKDIHGNFHISPTVAYCNYKNCGKGAPGFNCGADSAEWRANIKKHLDKIAEMGFNTIRLVGLSVKYRPDELNSKAMESNNYFSQEDPNKLKCYTKNKAYTIKRKTFKRQAGLMEEFVDIVKEFNTQHPENKFKVIILVGTGGLQDYSWRYTKYLSYLGKTFSKEPVVFAYEINSEPYHLGYPKYEKNQKYERAENFAQWYYALKEEAPLQLITFGAMVQDVLNWDAQCFPVDFINFHLYPNLKRNFDSMEAEKYKSILKWFSEAYDKPWIIGETSLAGNDVAHKENSKIATEEQQKEFAFSSLAYTKYYGGIGYIWWQYKEVPWFNISHPKSQNNYYGLVRRKDKNENHKIAVEAFQAFDPFDKCLTCFDPDPDVLINPYNYPSLNIEGKVTTPDGKPVKNVYINCKSKNKNYYTFTDENGRFKVYTAPDIVIFQLSASYPGMTVIQLGSWGGSNLDSKLNLKIDYLDKNQLP